MILQNKTLCNVYEHPSTHFSVHHSTRTKTSTHRILIHAQEVVVFFIFFLSLLSFRIFFSKMCKKHCILCAKTPTNTINLSWNAAEVEFLQGLTALNRTTRLKMLISARLTADRSVDWNWIYCGCFRDFLPPSSPFVVFMSEPVSMWFSLSRRLRLHAFCCC